jgi:hypothetical protein
MNTIVEIASRLSLLCGEFKFVEAYNELFSEHAESIDPNNGNEPLKGLDKLIDREEKFLAATELHGLTISDPVFAGNYFTVGMSFDFTPKGRERKNIEELCVYKVENGKIVSQQFFIG